MEPVDAIYFTHKDFLGASNQYRELWKATIYLHTLDAEHPLAQPFPVDRPFNGDFTEHGIEAFHIGGHSPGFMMYIYRRVLFICDYAFPPGLKMRLNSFGPQKETRDRAARILEIIFERSLETVCGFNFITEFDSWRKDFQHLLNQAR